MTRQALHGLGERIEATGGSDKLMTWATDVIAARKQGKHPPGARGRGDSGLRE
jgi:hypothetical protein